MALTPVFRILGILLAILAVVMLVPAIVDFISGHNGLAFVIAAATTLFFGVGLILSCRSGEAASFNLRQAFLLTNTAWLGIAVFATLPFILATPGIGLTDAFFESMSGITTTGASVIPVIEDLTPGVLIWRALLQWLGGVGIVVMALVILPVLDIGGMQLFRTESYETPDKVMPRAAEVAGGIFLAYSGLTAIWAFMYWLAGMPGFDAVAHSMTTIATGGFSTRTESIAAFDSVAIEWLAVGGMIVGSLPFAHYMAITRGGWRPLIQDSQVRWFLGLLAVIALLMIWQLIANNGYQPLTAMRYAVFNTVSVMTGTGYGSADYAAWGGSATVLLLVAMFMGGCSGSTTCGIKIFRLQVLASNARMQLARLLSPHSVIVVNFNGRPVSEKVMDSVMGFFYLYILAFVAVAVLLGLTGLDMITAISGAATSISNVGPGLGETIGPAGNFATLPDASKWIMCAAMLVGRLELFTVLILLMPGFWRN